MAENHGNTTQFLSLTILEFGFSINLTVLYFFVISFNFNDLGLRDNQKNRAEYFAEFQPIGFGQTHLIFLQLVFFNFSKNIFECLISH